MLKIGYDVTPLVGMCTGVGNYTRQLLTHMLAQEDEHDFLLLANRREATRDFPASAHVRPLLHQSTSEWDW